MQYYRRVLSKLYTVNGIAGRMRGLTEGLSARAHPSTTSTIIPSTFLDLDLRERAQSPEPSKPKRR